MTEGFPSAARKWETFFYVWAAYGTMSFPISILGYRDSNHYSQIFHLPKKHFLVYYR